MADKLQDFRLFGACSDAVMASFRADSQRLNLAKGKLLFVKGEAAERFYIVESGWVKLFRETVGGEQVILDIVSSGQMFGESAVFEGGAYSYSAEIIEPTKIFSLPLYLLSSEVESNPKFTKIILEDMAKYRKKQDQEIENRTLKTAPQRVGCFLLSLFEEKDRNGPVTVHLPYDKILVSARLGMQPETFSRALNKLKEHVDINVLGATITITNKADLVDYACGACSSEFPCRDIRS